MTKASRTSTLPLLERLFRDGTDTAPSDLELAARFAETRDPEAFAALVERHGAMVMAVCRGSLGLRGDLDDAFQATFLILMRRLGTFSVGDSLGGWLHRVARRVCRQARLSESRRRRREGLHSRRTEISDANDPERMEIVDLIRREIDLLPERYRIPIVLCDLQGLTRDEAAQRLGRPSGTVGGRLARGRSLLRERLERRAIKPFAAVPIEVALSFRSALETAIRSASTLGSGTAPTLAVSTLAARAMKSLGTLSLKAGIALVVALSLSVGLVAAGRDDPPPKPASVAVKSDPEKKAAVPLDPNDPKRAGHYEGRVLGPDGKPLEGARVYVAPENLVGSPGPIRAKTGPDGRFEFQADDMTYKSLDGLPARRQGLLIAEADGYAPDSVVTWGLTRSSFHSHFDPVQGAELVLRLVRDDVPIRGRLLGPDGKPLAGAVVKVNSLQIPGHKTFDEYLETLKQATHLLLMPDFRSIHVSSEASKPVVADADGRFTIGGLGRDRTVGLEISAPGIIIPTYLTVMTRDIPDVVLSRDLDGNPDRVNHGANFEARLKAGKTVKGIVVDRETRKPIPGMLVGERISGVYAHPVLTDLAGRFTVEGIYPSKNPIQLRAASQPGMPYIFAQGTVEGDAELVIETSRGLPYRLKISDANGKPIGDDVTFHVEYQVVGPNPHLETMLHGANSNNETVLADPIKREGGIYEGFMLPGPGAIMVKAYGPRSYRPAFVDPKAFFAPGKTDWTAQEKITTYGTVNTISYPGSWTDQHDYAAIALVDPAVDAKGTLELSATLVEDKPRMTTLLGPDETPVEGVDTIGLTYFPWDAEPRLRASTFPIAKLHPDRIRPIKFLKEDKGWIGFLLAQGDLETPYIVKLQPWATIIGKLLDAEGKPLAVLDPQTKQAAVDALIVKIMIKHDGRDLFDFDDYRNFTIDDQSRFRVDRIIPGLDLGIELYRPRGEGSIRIDTPPFNPGEVRDLGDLHLTVTH